MAYLVVFFFFFQAEDGIRDLVRSRGLGDVYKRQGRSSARSRLLRRAHSIPTTPPFGIRIAIVIRCMSCLLYTSDAADERSSVDLGGRRIINKKKKNSILSRDAIYTQQYIKSLKAKRL